MDFSPLFKTAEEAAQIIHHDYYIGVSGFAGAGSPKAVPSALAEIAKEEHKHGRPFKVSLISGASTGYGVDGVLAEAEAISYRIPYQSSAQLRKEINKGSVSYQDMHLSSVSDDLRFGLLPVINVAIIEAAAISADGEITLTTSGGNTPLLCQKAESIIIELNEFHTPRLNEIHDIYEPEYEYDRRPIVIESVSTRIGANTLKVDPAKIVAIVKTNSSDGISAFKPNTDITDAIGANVVKFLEHEYLSGKMGASFRPLQSGVGNIANSVLSCISRSEVIPPVSMYTEVAQDAVIDLIKQGRCNFVSACSLTVSDRVLEKIYSNFDFYKEKILIRPQEISNNPGICRQLGIISINTAIEVDIFGNVNSSHFYGTHMMNGIGGSGDFARNSAISIFVCPSTTKNGDISAIVPMVAHTDHTEHDVKIIVTEYGVADLRGKSPRERAACIIENCAHPDYKGLLKRYLELNQEDGHTPHTLEKAFCFHTAYKAKGDMRLADL